MKDSLFAEALSASLKGPQGSPQQSEKDRAIDLARRISRAEIAGCTHEEAKILARQLLRALALS